MLRYFESAPKLLTKIAVAILVIGITEPLASAALSNVPDSTWMTNGPIRAIVQYGNIVWIAGQFTELRQNPPGQGGSVISVSNLAAIDATTGAPVSGLSIPAVTGANPVAPGQFCS